MNDALRASGNGRRSTFSLEIFPPADPVRRAQLAEGLAGLAPLAPEFVSVTYGAGGTTRDRTIDMVERVVRDTPLDVAAHLTCVSASCADVDETVVHYLKTGVRRIVALRGDPPGGLDVPYEPHPEGYQNTADLVAGIRRIGDFDISVAAYPEKHPQSPDFETDFDTLKAKIDAGAARALTQFFFDNERFFDFIDRLRAHGITVPVVPGILPIVNLGQVRSFADKCGASIPAWIADRFEGLDDDPAARAEIGADIAAGQVAALIDAGHDNFHIYCLNRPDMVHALWSRIGAGTAAQVVV